MTENAAPEPIGFGIAELAFLLSSFDGPGQSRSIEALDAGTWAGDPTLAEVGVSGLAARGFVELEQDGLGIQGAASAVAHVLGRGTLWITLQISAGEGSSTRLVLVEAEGMRMLFQPGLLSTWFATPLPEELTASQTAVSVLHQHADENPGSLATVTVSTQERNSSYEVKREGEAWQFAGITENGPEEPVGGLGPAEVAALIEAAAL